MTERARKPALRRVLRRALEDLRARSAAPGEFDELVRLTKAGDADARRRLLELVESLPGRIEAAADIAAALAGAATDDEDQDGDQDTRH